MPPKVSVVMSVYNGAVYLAEAITSMQEQTHTDFEFIIVDDGSTDRSVQIIQDFALKDSRIQLIQLDQNVGLAYALNQGIGASHGEYIARMDSDDISQPSRLQQQVDYLDKHPEVGVLGSRMQVVGKDKIPLFDFDVPLQHSLIVWNLFFGRTFAHPSVMIRRNGVEQVGGYDETLSAGQDVDLWSRFVGVVQLANLPDKLVTYRTHDKATSIQKTNNQKDVLRSTLYKTLCQLWGDSADITTIDRFLAIRSQAQLDKLSLQAVAQEMDRLLLAMLDHGWILDHERDLVESEIKHLLDNATNLSQSRWRHWLRQVKRACNFGD